MDNLLSYVPGMSRLVGLGGKSKAVDVRSLDVQHIETDPDRRARCLKHLLKANHVNYSINSHADDKIKSSSNNLPHALVPAFFLGASLQQLNETYDAQIKKLGPWEPSPAELADEDWVEFRGNAKYARAYVDFFEDKLAMEYAYDWKKVTMHYLVIDEEPLIYSLINDGGSPLIRLALAFEVDSKELGMEGLGQAAVHYSSFHKYLDSPDYTPFMHPSPLAKGTVEELLGHMKKDERFQRLHSSQTATADELSRDQEELLLEYLNAWDLEDPTMQFQLSQEAIAKELLMANRPNQTTFDAGLAQLLVTSHAVRVLLPYLPSNFHVPMLRQWWLLAILTVMREGGLRKSEYGLIFDTAGKDWNYVQQQAVTSLLPKDVLSVQVIRAMQVVSTTWGDKGQQSLVGAVTFVDNFKGWQ